MKRFANIIIAITVGLLLFFGMYAFILAPQDTDEMNTGRDILGDIMQGAEPRLVSAAFDANAPIPATYTCDGDNISPPLSIYGVPHGTVSLALIMDDPDIPQVFKTSRGIDKFDHWVLFNLPPTTTTLEEGYAGEGMSGANSAGKNAYTGPCPPPEYEPTEHRYIFQLYALDATLDLPEGATESDVRNAMKGHIIGKAELVGVYDRKK